MTGLRNSASSSLLGLLLLAGVGCAADGPPSSARSGANGSASGSSKVGGAPSDGRVLDPLDNPQGESLSLAVRAGLLPLGVIPFDGFALPLISPDGRYAATQTGAPPDWPTALAETGQAPPYATVIEIHRFDVRLDIPPTERLPPQRIAKVDLPSLLGRTCDRDGFLIEAPQEDGSRWIGEVAWETGAIQWLVQDSAVNAFAALESDGRLAWCRRAKDSDRFDLVVRDPAGEQWSLPGAGGDWLMPVWSSMGNGLYALHRENGRLRICYGQANGQRAFEASVRDFLLMANSDRYAAYQAFSGQGAIDGAAPGPAGAPGEGAPLVLLLHPGAGRMVMWKPMSPRNVAAVQLNAHSLTALQHSAGSAIVGLRKELMLQSLHNPDARILLSSGTWVPRRTPEWEFPYVALSPQDLQVQITALKLLPIESSAASSPSVGP